jgi:hypothetical protein
MDRIPEHDWKYLRQIHDELLEKLSKRINDKVREALADTSRSEYDRRGNVYGLVLKCDKVVAECFDDWRRSRAIWSLLALRHHGLLTDEQLGNLSEETRGLVGKAVVTDEL